jgi:hypothetical protein
MLIITFSYHSWVASVEALVTDLLASVFKISRQSGLLKNEKFSLKFACLAFLIVMKAAPASSIHARYLNFINDMSLQGAGMTFSH